jgi:nucleoporin GLE1
MAGILTFYFAILQTSLSPLLQAGPPEFAQPTPEALEVMVVEPLRLPAAWSWLAAIGRMPLASLDPAPLLVAVALEIIGPEMGRVYGQRQVGKVLMALATEGLGEGVEGEGVLANSNVPARQRLRLMIVEQWGSTGVLKDNKARDWE